MLVVIGFGGSGDAIAAMPEQRHVQIDREDLFLREIALHPVGDEHLGELAARRLVQRQEHVAGGLLGDGAAALAGGIGRDHVGDQGAGDAGPVEAAVFEEPVVLGRQHGLPHHVGDLLVAHGDAPLLADLRDQPPGAGIDPQRHGELDAVHVLGRGQGRGEVNKAAGQGEADGQKQPDEPEGSPAKPAKIGRVHGFETLWLRPGGG